jgi:hypothetical protein
MSPQGMMHKSCHHCGNGLKKRSLFCDICGTKVSDESEPESPSPQTLDSLVDGEEGIELEEDGEEESEPERLETSDVPLTRDYKAIGFLLVAVLLILLGVFSPPVRFHIDSDDYWPKMLYLLLACLCLAFAFVYKKAKT